MTACLLHHQLHRLLRQRALLLVLGLAPYLLDKHEGLPPDVVTGLLLAAAAGKTGHLLLHNLCALAVLRETFQQFLLLVSLNMGMIALSFALDLYCLCRGHSYAFTGLRAGSELEIFGQLFYHSVGTLISNPGGSVTAAAGPTQVAAAAGKDYGLRIYRLRYFERGQLPRAATAATATTASLNQPS